MESKYAIQVVIFLHELDYPVPTRRIVDALGVSNWVAISNTLRKLQKAGLITVQNARVGRKKSPARLWQIESEVGVKVAEGLEEIDRRMSKEEVGGLSERRAIGSTELEEKLVTVVRSGLKKVTGA